MPGPTTLDVMAAENALPFYDVFKHGPVLRQKVWTGVRVSYFGEYRDYRR
jgi:hypothetical protein